MKNQKGFSALVIILILVVVGVACGAGYYVRKKNQNITVPPPTVINETKITSTPSPAKYSQNLDITEWGIRVSFSDADKVTYKISFYNSSASLFLKDSVTNIDDCKPLGLSLYRGAQANSLYNNNIKVGSYYYWLTGGPGACSNEEISKLRATIVGDELGSNKYNITSIN